MKRKICGFFKDDRDDWTARLDCHHNQHVRHNPPFQNRPWVETDAGQKEKLGMELDCVRCDRAEFPDGLTAYKRTPDFDETSIPAGLRKDHSTKSGTWGLIKVLSGQLEYRVGERFEMLRSDNPGIVVPNVLHNVTPAGEVTFYVEFYRGEAV